MAEEIKRKASVPKLDRVISFVLAGEYDGQLGELRSAIDKRNEERKQSVMSLVHEVFGDDAKVVSDDHTPRAEPNLFMRKASAQKETASDDGDVVTPDALADLDGTERQMLSEAEQSRVGRGSAIISGLSAADIGD